MPGIWDRRWAWLAPVLVATGLTAATLAVMPHESVEIGPKIGFVPAVLAVVACLDVLSAYLLLMQFRDTGESRILAMSCAYSFSLIVMAGYGGAFPNVVEPVGPLATAPSVAPWLYVLWHTCFPVALGAAWMPWPAWLPLYVSARRRAIAGRLSHLAALLAAGVLVALVVKNGPSLPVLIQGLDTTRMSELTGPVALPLVLASTAITAWALRRRTGPERWTAVAVWACLLDLSLTYASRHRYSLGWYAGRSLTLFAAAVVLMAMLRAMTRTRRQLLRSERNLSAVGDVVRGILNGADARSMVVSAALALADGATIAALVESDSAGALVITASTGMSLAGTPLPTDESSTSAQVWRTGEKVLVSDLAKHSVSSPTIVKLMGVTSALWLPISDGGTVVAVLAVTWRTRVASLSDQAVQAVMLLADEAAVALRHQELLTHHTRLAQTDALTGLPNRRAWDERLAQMMATCARLGEPLTVALLDLDFFKKYNDAHGHLQGDVLLQEFADAARARTRGGDLLARWGGEEFAVALYGTDAAASLVPLHDLRQAVPDGQTCSIGFATWDGSEELEDLMDRADRALYRAKAEGRDRVERAVGEPDVVPALPDQRRKRQLRLAE